jgi:hypothetical protein
MASPRFVSADSFVCRYTWIPKLVRGLSESTSFLANQYDAMVKLGVGANMVNAIKTWGKEMGVMEEDRENTGFRASDFAQEIFGYGGLDEFLEDQSTLWLLHWNLCTQRQPLHAWDYLINNWHKPDFSSSEILLEFSKDEKSTEATRKRHLEVFLRTYVGSSSAKNEVQEDNLDSPLVELNFLRKVGERAVSSETDSGKREAIYSFRVEGKPEVSDELLIYCLTDYWEKSRDSEETLDFAGISSGRQSVGQVFKLPESSIRRRLESLDELTGGAYEFDDSAAIPKVVRSGALLDKKVLLEAVYQRGFE